MKDFSKMERNTDRIQFAELRQKLDEKYNDTHDELSDCFYNKKPFRGYGILDKETFDKLHGLIFHMQAVEFHQENLKQPEEKKVPEEKYNTIFDEKGDSIGSKVEKSEEKITQLRTDGIELEI